MTFQPGHKGFADRGPRVEKKRALRSLAIMIREDPRLETALERAWEIAHGRNPTTGEPVEPMAQLAALKIILERGFGQPAQHVVLEGHIRNEVLASAEHDERRPKLSLDAINERRRRLRDMGIEPKALDVTTASAVAQAVTTPTNEDE